MKKIAVFIICFLSINLYSQQDAWVYFNDKPNASTYLSNPLSMLTQRALDRRTTQGIALDATDVPVEQNYIDQIAAATGITIKAKSKWLNCLHIRGTQANIQALTSLPFVNHIYFADTSLNKINIINNENKVSKPLDVEVVYNYGNSLNQVEMLNAQFLHQQDYTGSGKIIAVLDSGFINANTITPLQRLFTNNLILGSYNYVNRTTNVYDLHNHGTMTLSCMGGYVDGQLVGTAPNANYYLYVTEDVTDENPVEESYWVEAAEEADRVGADVISSSLGYLEFPNYPQYNYTYNNLNGTTAFSSKGANIAFSKGIIVVVSAGNNGAEAEPHVTAPAEAINAIAVGAVRADEVRTSFSAIGPSFDGRIKPDLMAKGQGSSVALTDGTVSTNGNGTSFSCPILAGAITSFWSAFPNLTNQQVVNFVKQSADRYANPDAEYGYGIPNFQQAVTIAQLSTTTIPTANHYTLYPNPAQEQIMVSFTNGFENSILKIYNPLGQIVLEKQLLSNNTTVSITTLQVGAYYYKLEGKSVSKSGTILKK